MLRILNSLLLTAFLAVLFAVWWLVGRAAPQRNGTLDAPVATTLTIARDHLGIPHITAQSIDDVLFAQGFVTAQDRLWQMDMIRRLAAGELSEIIGRATLESDTLARKMRLRRVAEQHLRSLSGQERAYLAAYARGVNHYIETHRGRWSPEFALLRYEPRPWTLADTLLAGLQMDRTLTDSWKRDLLRYRMTGAGDPDKVRRLFPNRSSGEVIPGSNAWAISGAHSASGRPILANDPHLEYTAPSPFYLVHLQAPGLNVIGATLPGVPFVLIGHNAHIAWGVTSLQFDTQDLYIQKMDLRAGRYAYQSEFLDARRENELIAVRNDKPAEIVNLVTRHGPIFAAEGRDHMALRWAAAEPLPYSIPLLSLNAAANWDQFRAALARYQGPGLNFLYADRQNNIGHQVAGRLPRRHGFLGDLPLDGASGLWEWRGMIPFDQLPSYFNPPEGRVASSNHNPFPDTTQYTVSGFFDAPYRQRQIHARLAARPTWAASDMISIQTDTYSAFSHFLARQAVAAAQHPGPAQNPLREAVDLLQPWNGRMDANLAAPALAEFLYNQVRRLVAESAAPGSGADYRTEMAPAAIESLLRERPPGWFPDWDAMLREALQEALDEGRRRLGRTPANWRYGRLHTVTFAHPVLGRVRGLASWFNVGPLEMSGSPTSVRQTTPRLGPAMRFVADLDNWDHSLICLATGQSGHITSGHYKDQWDEHHTGRAFLLQFDNVKAESTLTLRPGILAGK